MVFFFFSAAGILVFITAQLALQMKIHLCLLNCYLKWLPPTVTVGYYVVIYAFSGNGSIAWIFKNEYTESTFFSPLVFNSLLTELCFEFLVKLGLICTADKAAVGWIN